MIAPAKVMAASGRLGWLDANRAMAAVGIVLIHSTTDFAGQAFSQSPPADRVFPVLARSVADLSGSEMFFVFSLFLLAFKLDRRELSYGQTIRDQASRLLIPFVFWTIFYAFFRLAKASVFGYAPAILGELGQWQSWVGYFLLGSAQYHLHFLPTLFALVLFYPVMRVATRYPIVGVAVFGLLGAMDYVQGYIWGAVSDVMIRDYLLRLVKILGYVGYGFAAFALYGYWKTGIPPRESQLLQRGALFLTAFAFIVTLPLAGVAIDTGQWPAAQGWAFYARFLMPLFIFAAFVGSQHANWSPSWSKAARYTFGVYLVHPILVDLYDIAVYTLGIVPAPAVMVTTKFLLVTLAAFGLAYLISRATPLAWTIGLGPAPWPRRRVTRAVTAAGE